MTKHDLSQTTAESEREIQAVDQDRSTDSNSVHMGLNQITVFERSDETGKLDNGDNNAVEQETNHVWTSEEVELLLKLYKAKEDDLKDPRRKKKTIWNEICSEMRLSGFSVSPGQCECKMKNLKATYRRNLDRARAGDNVNRCAFYDELYDIFGLCPHVRVFPNMKDPLNSRKRSLVLQPNNMTDVVEEITSEDQKQGPNQKRLRSEITDTSMNQDNESQRAAELMEKLNFTRKALDQERQAREEERKKYEEERDRRAREFHEERMAMLNSMNKLISSLGNK
eukprot:gene3178-3648_t